tara:strand:+ start:290 stop:820 length:531 start_codon:yes stop_codon:yes gene_type:complete
MKEKLLRDMIRKQIKSSLTEAPDMARSAVGASLGRVEKMAGVKMLKKALGTGSPAQQAAGLLKVVQSISGNNPTVGKMLARMIMKGGIAGADTAPVAEENYTAGIDDGNAAIDENQALQSKMGRVDKTQAMKQLKNQLGNKPATVQTDFVIDLINGLDLKDAAKKRLLLQLRKNLK